MSKIEGLPKIYYINLDTATDRNEYMLGMFKDLGITNFERYEAKRYPKTGHRLLNPSQFGCMMSHIDICKLISNGTDEYAIILEDDIDLSAIDLWDFTWESLISKVPKFDVLQLHRQEMGNFDSAKLRQWEIRDHSTAAYMITKSYAKAIVRLYERNSQSLSGFKSLSKRVGPVADFAIYYHGTTYSTCIFNIKNFPSQIAAGPEDDILNSYKLLNEMFSKPITLNDIIN